jgi:2-dehydro-3-deoxygalactonokinase
MGEYIVTGGRRNHIIFVDWSAHFFKAWFVSPKGEVIRRVVSQDGVLEVSGRQFLQIFNSLCGSWLIQQPDSHVIMIGAICSDIGWKEVEYLPCPVTLQIISSGSQEMSLGGIRNAQMMPGVHFKSTSGLVDRMNTAASIALGAGQRNGVVCIPAEQHTHWVELKDGAIERFCTFMSVPMVELLKRFFNLLYSPQEKEDLISFERGLAFAWRSEDLPAEKRKLEGFSLKNLSASSAETQESFPSLLRTAAELRLQQHMGKIHARHMSSCIWGIVVGDEISHALQLFGNAKEITLVAEGVAEAFYERALVQRECIVTRKTTEDCLLNFVNQLDVKGEALGDVSENLSVRSFNSENNEFLETTSLLQKVDIRSVKDSVASETPKPNHSRAMSPPKATASLVDLPFVGGLASHLKNDKTY